jgi:hypothetical protein
MRTTIRSESGCPPFFATWRGYSQLGGGTVGAAAALLIQPVHMPQPVDEESAPA